jgi:hypothetical protein
MTVKRKPQKDLATRIMDTHEEADALVDLEAERMQRVDGPGVPVAVLRQMFMARHQCVCSAALAIINDGLAQWPEDKAKR